nr:hypothetical protein [Tanacetum cinerariifolium]
MPSKSLSKHDTIIHADNKIWAIMRNYEMLTWPEKTKIWNWALDYNFRRSSHKGKRHVSHPTVAGETDQLLPSSDRTDVGGIWAIMRNNEMLTWPEKTRL